MTNDYLPHATASQADSTIVAIESECFVAFDSWMDEQLEQLVARWIHTAAPSASRFERARLQIGDQSAKS